MFTDKSRRAAIPIWPVAEAALEDWLKQAAPASAAWARAQGFKAGSGALLTIPDGKGGVAGILLGLGRDTASQPWPFASAAAALPTGAYQIAPEPDAATANAAALGWALGQYRFAKYKKPKDAKAPVLVWPRRADRAQALAMIEATTLVRDLVNTPTADLGPADLADGAQKLARAHKAKFREIVGADLLKQNFPAIHAVGRAAAATGRRAPRLIELSWGPARAPKVTLVGKGVCFDSGGLDIKPSSGMRWMKKDMGGAAHVLGLAHLIIAAKLQVRLRVLIPAVENSISGDAYRPGDVLASRKGLTIEIGNTDAEGRVILADALALANEDKPDLLIDFATLTGAARVALGTEVPAFFTDDDKLAADLAAQATAQHDPLWPLPLWEGYADDIDSRIADITNSGDSGFGGAITAALFLKRFAGDCPSWLHIDLNSWNNRARPGRPVGGEAQGMRAVFAVLQARYKG